MKKIICSGDSHTWGQGASGALENFKSPIVAGDLRLADFVPGSYVNLLRNYVNSLTHSDAHQYGVDQKSFFEGKNIFLTDEYIKMQQDALLSWAVENGMLRIQIHCTTDGGQIRISKDHREIGCFDTDINIQGSAFHILNIDLQNNCEITLQAIGGAVEIFKVEVYTGPYAVINAGVGSTSAEIYLDQYWLNYIEKHHPFLIILETHAINDWLQGTDMETYCCTLNKMLRKSSEIGSHSVMMTVSPIMGNQIMQQGCYDRYIDAVRELALKGNADFIDANAIIRNRMYQLSPEKQQNLLFDDLWHVNDYGHQLYFEAIKIFLQYHHFLPDML